MENTAVYVRYLRHVPTHEARCQEGADAVFEPEMFTIVATHAHELPERHLALCVLRKGD
ncbi:MAG: hypothetical protein ACYTEQ_30920 [Planctomycetota bacterium]|jgi:hypothetical protein